MNVALHWSGGKDSALSHYYLKSREDIHLSQLLTTVSVQEKKVLMHQTPFSLITAQAEALEVPLSHVMMPDMPSRKVYDQVMEEKLRQLKMQHVDAAAFGDIFLEDLKTYREEQCMKVMVEPVFPLWRRDTADIANEFVELGFKAVVISVNLKQLPESFLGREFSKEFISDLPSTVDPSGENGEYHTFVYDGPTFSKPVKFHRGDFYHLEWEGGKVVNYDTSFMYLDVQAAG